MKQKPGRTEKRNRQVHSCQRFQPSFSITDRMSPQKTGEEI